MGHGAVEERPAVLRPAIARRPRVILDIVATAGKPDAPACCEEERRHDRPSGHDGAILPGFVSFRQL